MFERKTPPGSPSTLRPAAPIATGDKPPMPSSKAPPPVPARSAETVGTEGPSPSGAPRLEARQHGDRTLIVGRGIAFSAEISACDHLIVEGTVEARLPAAQSIEITESGLFRGTAGTCDGDIGGRFEGTLTVSGRLIVRATGRIEGKIEYGELAVEAGGRIDGELRNIHAKSDTKPGPETSAAEPHQAGAADAPKKSTAQ